MGIDTSDPAYIDSLMPSPQEEYEDRCEATFAKRLAIILIKNGTLSQREACDLLYPSEEQLDEVDQIGSIEPER
jgi:hypothetical protein